MADSSNQRGQQRKARKRAVLIISNPDADMDSGSDEDTHRGRPTFPPYLNSPTTPMSPDNHSLAPTSLQTRSPVIRAYKIANQSPLSASGSSSASPAEDTTPSPSTPSQAQPPASFNVAGDSTGGVEGLGLVVDTIAKPAPFYDRLPPTRELPRHTRRPSGSQRTNSSPGISPGESRDSPINQQQRQRGPQDRLYIMATTDGELLAKVDITGARDAGYIRERIFTKLQIPDSDQPYFDIYRTHLDDFTHNTPALKDDELLRACYQYGDAMGTLKFLVVRSSTGVPVDGVFLPPAPVSSPPIPNSSTSSRHYPTPANSRQKASPHSKDDSQSSASERHSGGDLHSAGYQASDEEGRNRIVRGQQNGRGSAPNSAATRAQSPPDGRVMSPPPGHRAAFPPPSDRRGNSSAGPSSTPARPAYIDAAHARRPSESGADRERALAASENYDKQFGKDYDSHRLPNKDEKEIKMARRAHAFQGGPSPIADPSLGVPMERTPSQPTRPRPEPWAVPPPPATQTPPYVPRATRPLPPTQPSHQQQQQQTSQLIPHQLSRSAATNSRRKATLERGTQGPPPYSLPVGPSAPVIPGKSPVVAGQPGQPMPSSWVAGWASNSSAAARPSAGGAQRSLPRLSTRSESNLRQYSDPGPPGPPPPLPHKHTIPDPHLQSSRGAHPIRTGVSRPRPSDPHVPQSPSPYNAHHGRLPHPPSPTTQHPPSPAYSSTFVTQSPRNQTDFVSQPLPPPPPHPPTRHPMPLIPGASQEPNYGSFYPNGVSQLARGAVDDHGYNMYPRPQSSHDNQSSFGARPRPFDRHDTSRPYSDFEASSPRSPHQFSSQQRELPLPSYDNTHSNGQPSSGASQMQQQTRRIPPTPHGHAYLALADPLPPPPHAPVETNIADDTSEGTDGTLKAADHAWLLAAIKSRSDEATLVPPSSSAPVPSSFSTSSSSTQQSLSTSEEVATLVNGLNQDQYGDSDGEYGDSDEDSYEDDGDLWATPLKAAPSRANKRKSGFPRLTLQTQAGGGGGGNARMSIQPPTPAGAREPPPPMPIVAPSGGSNTPSNASKRPNSFARRNSVTWAPRPPAETVYEHIDDFFPDHDLDKEVIDVPSGASSPTAVEAPAAPTGFASRKHKKSIRIVASERKKALDRTSKLQATSASTVLRKRSTKLWGSKVEEVTPAQARSGLPSSIPESPNPNQRPVFKWVKGELIGKGTYGRVYLALNATTGEMLAVKQVEMPKTASDRQDSRQVTVVEALKSESDTLGKLDHPHIVQYLGFEQTDDFFSIFLEYVPGGSVGGCIRNHGKFDDQVVRSFTGQMLSGLAYLHSCNILHRDMKADNILVDPSGICKISDFGISKRGDDIYSNNDALTQMQGTVFWMAPEVLFNNKQGYNAKIDVWSLGCVVLEMWAGRRPWEQEDVLAVMFKVGHLRQAPPVPEEVKLGPIAEDFRLKCFAIDPAERPTAAELLKHEYLTLTPGWVFTGFN